MSKSVHEEAEELNDYMSCDQHGPYEFPLRAAASTTLAVAEGTRQWTTVTTSLFTDNLVAPFVVGHCIPEGPVGTFVGGASGLAAGATTAVAVGGTMEACHYGRGYNITMQDFENAARNSWYLRYIFLRIPYCKGEFYRSRGRHLAILAALDSASTSLGMLLDYGFDASSSTKDPRVNDLVEKAMSGRGGKIFTSPAHEYKEPHDKAQEVEVRLDEYSFDIFNAAGVFGAKARAGGLEVLATHFIRSSARFSRDDLGRMATPSIFVYQTESQFNRSSSVKYGMHWLPRSTSKASQNVDIELTPFQAASFSGCVDGLRRVSRLFSGEALAQVLNHSVKGDIVIGANEQREALLTPVFMAIVGNRPECLDFLLGQELTDKEFLVDGHRSYLFFATLYNRVKCVQVLLKHRATTFIPQFSPFIIAAKGNLLAVLHLLYKHWKQHVANNEDELEMFVNLADDDGKTAAYHAANNGHKDALDRVVVDYNADFKTRRDALSSSNLKEDKYGGVLKLLVFGSIGVMCCVAFWANFTYGEINYSCIRYYDNILLQPYLVIFLNTIVFLFVQSGLDNITKTFYFSLALKDFLLIYFGVSKSEVNNANREEIKAVDEEEQCFDGFAELKAMVLGKGKERDPEKVEDFCFGFKHSRTTFVGRFLTVWENVSEGQSKKRYLNEVKTDEYYTGSDFCTQFFWIFFYIQFANAIVAIVVAFIKSDVASSRLSRWERYEDIFAVIVNSGVSSFVVSAYLIHIVRPEQIKTLREWLVQFLFQTPQFEEQPFLPELQRRLQNLAVFPVVNLVMGTLRPFLFLSGKYVVSTWYAATTFLWTLGFAISTVLFFAYLDGYTLVPTCLTAFAPLLLVALVQLYLGLGYFVRGMMTSGGFGPAGLPLSCGFATFWFAAVVAMIGFKLDFPVESQWLPWRAVAGIMWFTWLQNVFFGSIIHASVFNRPTSDPETCLSPNFFCYLLYGLPFLVGFSMYAWVTDVGSALSPFPFYSYFLMQQIWSFLSAGCLWWMTADYNNTTYGDNTYGHICMTIYGVIVSWWQSMLVVFVATKAYPSLTSYSLVMIPTYFFLFGAAMEHAYLYWKDPVRNKSGDLFPYRSNAWVVEKMIDQDFFYELWPISAGKSGSGNDHRSYLTLHWVDDPYVKTIEEMMASHYDLFEKEKRTFWRSLLAEAIIFLPGLFILPPIVTHVIPGLFVFAWISIPVMTLAYLSYYCSREDFHRNLPSVVRYFLRLQYEVSSRFVAIFLLQVLYNYSSILCSKSLPISPSDYIDVITFDYKIRTQSYCFFNSLWEGVGKAGEANARTIITFMAWL